MAVTSRYAAQQNHFIERRQEGTGQWLLNSNEFQAWLKQTEQTLFCPGIPGAGKTIITSIVVDYLQTTFQNDANIGIAYLYFNYQQQQEQKVEDLLSSLLKQLAQEQLPMHADVKNLYKCCKTRGTRPLLNEIVKVLHSTIQLYSRVFIIIDALDECNVSKEGLYRLLSEVFSLQVQAQVNFFAMSRFVPEIMRKFQKCIRKEICAMRDDVLRYVDGRILELLKSQISEYPGLQKAVRTEVVKAVDGMLLLAKLYIDSLMSKVTCGDIKLALQSLPRGVKGLDIIYNEAMKRIDGQGEGFRALAKKVLSWITHAKRQLTTTELQCALAVRHGAVELDEDFVPAVGDIVSACAGLVTVDEQSNIIRWIHYTTQEYFERTWKLWVPDAQADIASVCLAYLSFDVFVAGFCLTDEKLEARLRLHVLYDYAARNWGNHARAAWKEVEQLILDLLESEAKASSSSQAMIALRSYSGYSQRVPRQITGAHLAVHFGLSDTMEILLKNGHVLNPKDTYGRTPLLWAATGGCEAVSAHEGRRRPGRQGQWRLDTAVAGRKDIEPDPEDNFGHTPLSWAAGNGHEVVVKLLLKKDIDVDSKDTAYSRTPLSWAATKYEAVVKLLLEKVDDANPMDNSGQTALEWATKMGYEGVVELLLEYGSKP